MKRRTMLTTLAYGLFAVAAAPAFAEDLIAIDVAKTSSCGCCIAWTKRLEAEGFAPVSRNFWAGELIQHKLKLGVPETAMSCHTATVDGYVIEGHVPPADIRRLLAERPDAVGLAVPGMPLGSPGMDQSDERDAYDVLLIRRDGSTEVYASYPGS